MTIGWNSKLSVLFRLLVLLALFASWTATAQGVPSIEVQMGFNGHVVPERYAPLRIRVRDFGETGAATIRVTQTLGNPWRGTGTVLLEPTISIAANGVYRTTIPVYDPLNPIFVSLIDSSGATLAEEEVDLRSTRHLEPFPVVYGALPHPLESGTLPVTAIELPDDWWAYDVAESLWISGAPPQESWDAIARWIFAGGTAVLLSGPDYFRFDCQAVRDLLPLTDPAVVRGPNGVESLIGVPRRGTETLLHRDGVSLLFIRSYGAGHVALVTMRAADLTRNEIELIADSIPVSTRLSLTDVSEASLGALAVVRPSHTAAILLGIGGIAGFGASVAVGRKHRKGAMTIVLVLFTVLSVLSGLYAQADKTVTEEYSINTVLQIQTWFGISVDTSSFLWTRDGQLTFPSPGETVPMQAVSVSPATEPLYGLMPQSQAFPALFEQAYVDGSTRAPMRSGAQKTFYSYDTSASSLRLAYDSTADLLILDQEGNAEIEDGWFLFDGLGFHVSSVPHGTSTYSLDDVHGFRELAAAPADGSVAPLRLLSELFPFDKGLWFVGHSAKWDQPDGGVGRKVRLVTLYVVEGELDD